MEYKMSCEEQIYLFDFCGTLYQRNTTLGFLQFMRGKRSFLYDVKYIFLWIFAKGLKDLGLISPHSYTKVRVLGLKGISKEELDKHAGDFLKELGEKGAIDKDVFGQLEEAIQNGIRVVLISFTLQNLLDRFLDLHAFDLEAYGSLLEFDGAGRATGKYTRFIPGQGKYVFLKDIIDTKALGNALFFTDDEVADRDLIEVVGEVKLVGNP